MTRIDVNLSSEHGFMLLSDSKTTPVFNLETAKGPFVWTPDLLAFSVRLYVDGDAKVIVRDDLDFGCHPEHFSGLIECPSKSLSLYDDKGFAFVSVPLADDYARISLRMSEPDNPALVACVIKNMVTF